MAPPRDVVKIAVQKRDAIPQLIQLDQVTRPVRPTSTLAHLWVAPFPSKPPTLPLPQVLPQLLPTPGLVSDLFTCRQSPWPLY